MNCLSTTGLPGVNTRTLFCRQDTGIGISEDKLDRLFSRSDQSIPHYIMAAGAGLVISKAAKQK